MSTPDAEYFDLLNRYRAAGGVDLRDRLHTRYGALVRGAATDNGLPYPDPLDPVAEGADAMRALAEAVDPRLPLGICVGWLAFPSTAPDATATIDVTFPVGMFTERPAVTITAASGAPAARPMSAASGSATGFTAAYTNKGTSASGVGAYWSALAAPGSSAASLFAADDMTHDVTVTCPTPGCGNQGVAIPLSSTFVAEDGVTVTVDAYQCGVCGVELTPETEGV